MFKFENYYSWLYLSDGKERSKEKEKLVGDATSSLVQRWGKMELSQRGNSKPGLKGGLLSSQVVNVKAVSWSARHGGVWGK